MSISTISLLSHAPYSLWRDILQFEYDDERHERNTEQYLDYVMDRIFDDPCLTTIEKKSLFSQLYSCYGLCVFDCVPHGFYRTYGPDMYQLIRASDYLCLYTKIRYEFDKKPNPELCIFNIDHLENYIDNKILTFDNAGAYLCGYPCNIAVSACLLLNSCKKDFFTKEKVIPKYLFLDVLPMPLNYYPGVIKKPFMLSDVMQEQYYEMDIHV